MAPLTFLPGTLEALSNFLKELSMKKDKKTVFLLHHTMHEIFVRFVL